MKVHSEEIENYSEDGPAGSDQGSDKASERHDPNDRSTVQKDDSGSHLSRSNKTEEPVSQTATVAVNEAGGVALAALLAMPLPDVPLSTYSADATDDTDLKAPTIPVRKPQENPRKTVRGLHS